MHNIQVTFDLNPNNARSESSIAVDPKNPQRIVAASKKFTNPAAYEFTLATSYSIDAGQTWHPSSDLDISGWQGISDPALAWDDSGNLFLVALPFKNPNMTIVGIAVYKSTDGGKTWGKPSTIHTSVGDDKQWAAADAWSAQFKGRVYAAWDDGSNLRFARTKDHGATWIGSGNNVTPAGTVLANDSFAPEINVAPDGTIFIVWIAGTTLKMLVSTDGGDGFHAATPPATGISTLSQTLANVDGWPVFPGGKFRVLTLPTACAGDGQAVAVAWSDTRNGSARIYYALSNDRGQTWDTGPSGAPLLTDPIPGSLHHFHPQMVMGPNNVVCCAFYEFGPKNVTPLIDVVVATSYNGGQSFSAGVITDQPWNPAVDAPLSHGDANVTFIGDYFGLDASPLGLYPLWTDTRTGIQELFTERVPLIQKLKFDPNKWAIVAQILFGVIQDGGGAIRIGGHIIPVGPWDPDGPIRDILFGLATYQLASGINDQREAHALQRAALASVSRLVQREARQVGGQLDVPAAVEKGNGELVGRTSRPRLTPVRRRA